MSEKISVSAVAHRYGIVRQTVLAAISAGRLPAEAVPIAGERRVWLIDPADAERLWGRIYEEKHHHKTVPPDEMLHVLLISAAFKETAWAVADWAKPDDQARAAQLYTEMAGRPKSFDLSRNATDDAAQAVSYMARALTAAADKIRGIDTEPELGDGELKAKGNGHAAQWLARQGELFNILVRQLTENDTTFRPSA